MKSYPITSIVALLVLSSAITKSVKTSLDDDGKLTFGDAPNFLPVWPKVVAFAPLAAQLPNEIKDIDSEEAKEISELVSKEIGEVINEENLVEKINASLELVRSLHRTYVAFKA